MRGCSMSAGEKRFCASCTVERVGQGAADDGCGRKRGFARCGATEHWHCQALLAGSAHAPLNIGTARFIWQEPPSSGTARKNWQESPVRHPALALPVFFGFRCFFATQDWHCQRLLAWSAHGPLRIGTARESWLPGSRTSSRPPRRILQTATPLAPTATRTLSRCQYSEPIRDTNPTERNIPMFTELCIAFYTVMTLGIASAFLFTHAQQAK